MNVCVLDDDMDLLTNLVIQQSTAAEATAIAIATGVVCCVVIVLAVIIILVGVVWSGYRSRRTFRKIRSLRAYSPSPFSESLDSSINESERAWGNSANPITPQEVHLWSETMDD